MNTPSAALATLRGLLVLLCTTFSLHSLADDEYWVVLGSHQKFASAEQSKNRVIQEVPADRLERGVQVSTAQLASGAVYRLVTGPYDNLTAAQSSRTSITQWISDAWIVKTRSAGNTSNVPTAPSVAPPQLDSLYADDGGDSYDSDAWLEALQSDSVYDSETTEFSSSFDSLDAPADSADYAGPARTELIDLPELNETQETVNTGFNRLHR